jgi:hypothetical protein
VAYLVLKWSETILAFALYGLQIKETSKLSVYGPNKFNVTLTTFRKFNETSIYILYISKSYVVIDEGLIKITNNTSNKKEWNDSLEAAIKYYELKPISEIGWYAGVR